MTTDDTEMMRALTHRVFRDDSDDNRSVTLRNKPFQGEEYDDLRAHVRDMFNTDD